jgi:hypothetical protein
MALLPKHRRRKTWTFAMNAEEFALYLRDAERCRVMQLVWLTV